MEDLIAIYNKVNNYGRWNNMQFRVLEEGKIQYQIRITKDHLATPNVAHGGAIAAFMDAVLGTAALSASSRDGNLVATVEFKIHFLEPVILNDELTGFGNVIKKGRRIIVAEGKIFNQNNTLVATGSGTFNAYPLEKSGIKVNP